MSNANSGGNPWQDAQGHTPANPWAQDMGARDNYGHEAYPPTDEWEALPPTAVSADAPASKPNRLPLYMGIVVALIAIAAVIGFFVFNSLSGRGTGGSQDSAAGNATIATSPQEAATQPATSEEAAEPERPEFPQLPSGAVAVNDAAMNNLPGGDFNNVYRGSSVTSTQFSLAVRDAYVRNYLDTGDLNATLSVYSSVTYNSYSMSCSDNGQFVTCTGGNNAIVYIV